MAFTNERIRRIAAVHTLIGISVKLGGCIVDGFGDLDPRHIDGLLEELRLRIRECELELWSWEDAGRLLFDDSLEAGEDLAS